MLSISGWKADPYIYTYEEIHSYDQCLHTYEYKLNSYSIYVN